MNSGKHKSSAGKNGSTISGGIQIKIRSDFVTNSSTSCFVTIHVETKDGRHFCGYFDGYECNCEDAIGQGFGFSLGGITTAETGRDFLELLDELYGGVISDRNHLNDLFDETEKTCPKKAVRAKEGVLVEPGTQKELEELPVSAIRKVTIHESWDVDPVAAESCLTADLEKQEEHVLIDHTLYKGDNKKERTREEYILDWKTGEKNLIRYEDLPEEEEDDW